MAPSSSRRRRREASEDEESDSPKRRRVKLEADNLDATADNEFQPGAIVRVKVIDFVTYENAEFLPGPNLNMVIGPNGTGKSSLVCAICLGLGYSPKHLGRAGSVKEFVKHGKETATIEIELQKRPSDRANHVVRSQIRREQNSQKWWLNDKETTHKAVQILMKSLKIQVDNLCQFLPQDRVVEFAACTPVGLLHETLRAAAPEEMLEWQSQLQELHKDKKAMAQTTLVDAETLQTLETRQQGLQADVDRIREREEIQERVGNLRSALVLAKYSEVRNRYKEARERKKIAESALRRLQNESGPSLEAVNRKEEYVAKIDSAMPEIKETLKEAGKEVTDTLYNLTQAADVVKESKDKLDAEIKGFEKKKKDLAVSKQRITAHQADLKNQPPPFNAADWNQKIRAEEHNLRELNAEHRQASTDIEALKSKGKTVKNRTKDIEIELKALDTQQGQLLNLLKRRHPDVATGWEWLQEHKGEFEKEVFGPPMISCSVKDERYTDLVQTFLSNNDFLAFTVQTKNDLKKLSGEFYGVLSLSVDIRMSSQPLESHQPPMSTEEASTIGLDGFALDFLDGPAPVLSMFCSEKRMHQCGVSLKQHSDADYERILNCGRVSQWAAGKLAYIIRRRREYGPQAMATITRNVQPARFWTSQPVDSQEKADLNRLLLETKGELGAMIKEHTELRDKMSALDLRREETRKKMDALKSEKNTLQKEYQKWQSLPEKIESEERAKAAKEQAVREAKKSMADIMYEWDKATVKRAQLVTKHSELLGKMRGAHHASLEAKVRLIEARSDVAGLKRLNAGLMERLEAERQKVQTAAEEAATTKREGQELQLEVSNVVNRDGAKKELLTQLAEGKTPSDLEMDISAEEAKLDVIHAANPNVMREFERRAQEISRVRERMEASQERLAGLDQRLAELMNKWEPKLDELVSKINDAFAYNFEQISCAGEVRVHKDENFDLWALDIMVKFRENETLQQLTAHRQSGGERAVSTIFFLMALQSMAQSPFRVVDEINQGMDPRNERMVHERMVEIACCEHTSQYFLITPKLLTGLRYDAKMRVLCIASGEHMPRDGNKLDFARCLARQKTLMAAV
ncbi:hypothetical protein L249_2929 [Ophiocordyceps polyrhachis-furcata BCC 54312]|uniref:Structural maintenance of chromosomes protein 5 n=1 Tax=Ophiocordyceps polyrhachis-furcata BCC 54312 TaxID=1330021 RepID=A0A367LSP2_9HYPO|nr:hypothetical protein L249_2929 [Ophiocordyceps polyrhachis-furcata BCC 54312]